MYGGGGALSKRESAIVFHSICISPLIIIRPNLSLRQKIILDFWMKFDELRGIKVTLNTQLS